MLILSAANLRTAAKNILKKMQHEFLKRALHLETKMTLFPKIPMTPLALITFPEMPWPLLFYINLISFIIPITIVKKNGLGKVPSKSPNVPVNFYSIFLFIHSESLTLGVSESVHV